MRVRANPETPTRRVALNNRECAVRISRFCSTYHHQRIHRPSSFAIQRTSSKRHPRTIKEWLFSHRCEKTVSDPYCAPMAELRNAYAVCRRLLDTWAARLRYSLTLNHIRGHVLWTTLTI